MSWSYYINCYMRTSKPRCVSASPSLTTFNVYFSNDVNVFAHPSAVHRPHRSTPPPQPVQWAVLWQWMAVLPVLQLKVNHPPTSAKNQQQLRSATCHTDAVTLSCCQRHVIYYIGFVLQGQPLRHQCTPPHHHPRIHAHATPPANHTVTLSTTAAGKSITTLITTTTLILLELIRTSPTITWHRWWAPIQLATTILVGYHCTVGVST